MPVMGAPSGVARVIGRALSERAPRSRYLVGLDAKVIAAWHGWVPTQVRDRLYRMGLGL